MFLLFEKLNNKKTKLKLQNVFSNKRPLYKYFSKVSVYKPPKKYNKHKNIIFDDYSEPCDFTKLFNIGKRNMMMMYDHFYNKPFEKEGVKYQKKTNNEALCNRCTCKFENLDKNIKSNRIDRIITTNMNFQNSLTDPSKKKSECTIGIDGYANDIVNQRWFKKHSSRYDSEAFLKYKEIGCFIVRKSESMDSELSLSVRVSNGFVHLKITQDSKLNYIIGKHGQSFTSIVQMIEHYSEIGLPVKGYLKIMLKH
ncbi:hypothetical protein A3Q56_04524 [Intoshia linei]|uniref:SH2 domain-containing protein n=1 Tax=Intoshia linei TaxID=1819745 RepID=A0A177B0W5_9BILA|nr:hypothetical protein A3Q56_04524 [Intoshia linei]